ncbi:hypothetical protein [Spirillospora sp. CA-294931]|uniref:hypothetical protein n=1 Tax=Spirillospora sp. CA-294931 TaxID=3240042 RepID=UPI003D91ED30
MKAAPRRVDSKELDQRYFGLTAKQIAALPTDPLGRTGTVISLPITTTVPLGLFTARKQLGTCNRQWIINPGSGLLLAVRDMVKTPPRGAIALPPGDLGNPRRLTANQHPGRHHRPGELSQYEAYAVTEWTDKAPA